MLQFSIRRPHGYNHAPIIPVRGGLVFTVCPANAPHFDAAATAREQADALADRAAIAVLIEPREPPPPADGQETATGQKRQLLMKSGHVSRMPPSWQPRK